MSTATTAPTAMPPSRANHRSTFHRSMTSPAAMALTPTMPNWPRLMLPPHPVSTTRETATSAQIKAKLSSTSSLALACTGSHSTTTVPRAINAHLATRSSGKRRSTCGTGLSRPAASHELSPVSALVDLSR